MPEREFSADDLAALSTQVLGAWESAVDRDWSVPAGSLEWSCWYTADHTVDCVFSYAFFLASRVQDAYPPFGELHALEHATPRHLVDGLRASTNLLHATIVTAEPGTRAVIQQRPHAITGTPRDFAARGALEMVLHAHDICTGLNVAFEPPPDIARRLREHVRGWPGVAPAEPTDDAWSDVLASSGRTRVNRPTGAG